MMRFLTGVLVLLMFATSYLCADVSANGGVAVRSVTRQRATLFPRRQVQVQRFSQPVAIRQNFVVQPYVQQFVVPQAIYAAPVVVQPQQFVVPQVQSFSSGCAASSFFVY